MLVIYHCNADIKYLNIRCKDFKNHRSEVIRPLLFEIDFMLRYDPGNSKFIFEQLPLDEIVPRFIIIVFRAQQ